MAAAQIQARAQEHPDATGVAVKKERKGKGREGKGKKGKGKRKDVRKTQWKKE